MKEIYHSKNNREKMQRYELSVGDARAVIDSRGAFVTELYDGDWQILFKKGEYVNSEGEAKTRGGCHPCFPNFGPADSKYGLPQHGPARDETWEVLPQGDEAIYLHKKINRIDTHVMYELGEKSLSTTLITKNEHYGSQPVAPGFHPYFNVGKLNEVSINGVTYNLDKDADRLKNTDYVDNVKTLQIDDRIINFDTNLTRFAIWSGGEADEEGNRYICVEPTLEGPSFSDGNTPSVLESDETKVFTFKMSW